VLAFWWQTSWNYSP